MTVKYFYACLILKLTLVTGQPLLHALKGRDAVLSPALPSAPDDILWKHNGDKVISFDGAEEHVFPPYEGRVTLGHETAELTITDVGYQDSGEYELDTLIRDRLYRSQYMLKVIDKVSKPVIGCELSDESSNSTVRRATLLCSSDSNTPETLTFKWNLGEKSQLGQSLSITLGDEHDHIEYSCTATNPLHAETSVFTAKDCYLSSSSSSSLDRTLDIIVPVIVGAASLIVLALCFIFRHQMKKASSKQRKNLTTGTDNERKDEGKPLMGEIHRQEIFASTQPLIQQNDYVIARPQREEIDKELKELRPAVNVRERRAAFTNPEETVLHRETLKEEKNDTHISEMASSDSASPITNGQLDSDPHRPESNGGSDADSHHSSVYADAQEQQEPQSPSPSSDPQGLLSKPLEPEADLNNSSQNSHTADKANDSTKSPEQKDSLDQPPHQSNVTASDQDSRPETVTSESTEQTAPDDTSGPGSASELEDPETDVPQNESVTPNHKATGEAELSNESPPSPLQSKPPESLPLSVQDKKETSSGTRPDPDHKDKDPQTDSDHESVSSDDNNENNEDSALTYVQPPDTHQLEVGSASSQSGKKENQNSGSDVESDSDTEKKPHEPDSSNEEPKESKETTTTENTATGDLKQPGIAEEMMEVNALGRVTENVKLFTNNEQTDSHLDTQTGSGKEAAESTLDPISALSQSADKKESNDTDAETIISAQVSGDTKGNTDSQDSEQINEADEEVQQ